MLYAGPIRGCQGGRRPTSKSPAARARNPIAIAIRARRVALCITQIELAVTSGVYVDTIQRIEAGRLGQWQNIEALLVSLGLELEAVPTPARKKASD